jgi:hypothetical protein
MCTYSLNRVVFVRNMWGVGKSEQKCLSARTYRTCEHTYCTLSVFVLIVLQPSRFLCSAAPSYRNSGTRYASSQRVIYCPHPLRCFSHQERRGYCVAVGSRGSMFRSPHLLYRAGNVDHVSDPRRLDLNHIHLRRLRY